MCVPRGGTHRTREVGLFLRVVLKIFRAARDGKCSVLCKDEICNHTACMNDFIATTSPSDTCRCPARTPRCGGNMQCTASESCACNTGFIKASSTDDTKGCRIDFLTPSFDISTDANAKSFLVTNEMPKVNDFVVSKGLTVTNSEGPDHFVTFYARGGTLGTADVKAFLDDVGITIGRRELEKGIIVSEQCSNAAYAIASSIMTKEFEKMGFTVATTSYILTRPPLIFRTKVDETFLDFGGIPTGADKKKLAGAIVAKFITTIPWANYTAAILSQPNSLDVAENLVIQLMALASTKGATLIAPTNALVSQDLDKILSDNKGAMAECFTDVESTLCSDTTDFSGSVTRRLYFDMGKSSATQKLKTTLEYDVGSQKHSVEVKYRGDRIYFSGTTTGKGNSPVVIEYGPGTSQLLEVTVTQLLPGDPQSWKIKKVSCPV